MRNDWVEVPSARLALSRSGGGPAVVFLHAGVADSRSWFGVMSSLNTDCETVAYDRRGFGDTTYQETVHSDIEDLWAVLDHVGVPDAVVVACSRGGQIAMDAAHSRPERISGLVVIGAVPPGAPEQPSSPVVSELVAMIDEADDAGELDRVNELEAQLWLDGPGHAGRVAGPVRDLFLDMNGRALRAAPIGSETSGSDPVATWSDLPNLRVPVLVGVGLLDLPDLVQRAREMPKLIPVADSVEFPGSAHLPMLDNPYAVTAAIEEFIHRVQQPSTQG